MEVWQREELSAKEIIGLGPSIACAGQYHWDSRMTQLDFVHNQLKYRGFTLLSDVWTHPDGHMIREDVLIRSKKTVATLMYFLKQCGQ